MVKLSPDDGGMARGRLKKATAVIQLSDVKVVKVNQTLQEKRQLAIVKEAQDSKEGNYDEAPLLLKVGGDDILTPTATPSDMVECPWPELPDRSGLLVTRQLGFQSRSATKEIKEQNNKSPKRNVISQNGYKEPILKEAGGVEADGETKDHRNGEEQEVKARDYS